MIPGKKISLRISGYFNLRKNSKSAKTRSLTPFLIIAVCLLAAVGFSISVESRSSGWLRGDQPRAPQINAERTKNSRTNSVSVNSNHSAPTNSTFTSPFTPTVTATKTDSLFTDVDGDTKADPGDTLKYAVTIHAAGEDANGVTFTDTVDPNTSFVAGTLQTTPLARPDSYSAAGNIRITVAAPGVLANDSDPDGVGPALNVTAGSFLSSQGGNVNLNADGSFTYNPPAGFEGNDTFTYTLNDGEGPSDTGTVTIAISGMIWFIDNNASCPCDGRLTNPFNTLASFDAVNDSLGNHPAANDSIFIYESAIDYVGPLTLEDGQKFIGQDATASLSSISGVTPPAGSDPLPATNSGNGTIVNITSGGVGITVAHNNTLRGFTGGNAGSDIDGANFVTLNISDVTLNGNGRALSLNTGALTATFGSISSTNSANSGINLIGITGTLTTGSTTITNPTAVGISLDTSSATFNFANTSVTGSGGTGVSLTTNTGTITFGSLGISPDADQKGLAATDNTNTITATSGTISTSASSGAINAAAVEISRASGTTPLALALTSVSTTSGTNGIFLKNTSGSFTVNGDGTDTSVGGNSTGGTISGMSGTDGATTGTAVYLNNVTNVTLRRMHIGGPNQNFGMYGTNVNGLTVEFSTVDGSNGDNGGADEGSLIFGFVSPATSGPGLYGTSQFNSNIIKGGIKDNFRVRNQDGTLDLTLNNNTIRDTSTSTSGNDNVHIAASLTANVTAHVTNNTFAATNGDHIQTIADRTSNLTIVATGNTLSGGGGVNALGEGITISGGDVNGAIDSTEVVRFDVSNNVMNGTIQGGAININEGVGNGNWQGRVSSNTIGTAAVAGSGASQSSGIRVENHSKGTLTATVLSNTVHQWSTQGINVSAGDTSATGLTNGPLNVTITGNTVDTPNNNPPTSVPDHGIQLNIGTQTGNTNIACADYLNNNSTGNLPQGGVDYRLRQRMLTTIRLPGYTGANNDNAAVRTYILGRPKIAGHGMPNDVAAANNVAGGGG